MALICSTDLALCFCQFLNIRFLSRNELMKRRIQETDGNRVALQSFVQSSRSRPADTAGSSPELLLSLLQSRNRSSHGMHRFCLPRRTYARYGKGRYPLRQAHELSWHLQEYLHWYEPSSVLYSSAHAMIRPNSPAMVASTVCDCLHRRCYR